MADAGIAVNQNKANKGEKMSGMQKEKPSIMAEEPLSIA